MKSRLFVVLCLLAVLLAAGPALADATYVCTGTDDLGIATCIATATPGTCNLVGTCVVTAGIVLNVPVTISGGPGVGPGASVTRASGSVFLLRSGSSGSVIENLDITSGAGNCVTNNASSAGAPLDQPDDITIRNNICSAEFRCVQQYNHNGPPFNDVNRETGAPAGYSTGWWIVGNRCESRNANDVGLLLTGSYNVVANNYVASPATGMVMQNNVNASTPSVMMFGAAPALNDNLVYGNTFEILSSSATVAFYPTGVLEFGYDFFSLVPEAPGDRAFNNRYEKNCFTVTDTGGNFAFSTGHQTQLSSAETWIKNDFTQGLSGGGVDGGNAAFVSFDTNTSTWAKNDSAGAADYNMLSLLGTEFGNNFLDNKVGIGWGNGAGFIALDFGPGPNNYGGTKYCTGGFVGGVDIGGNLAGHYCSHQLSPARSCGTAETTTAPLAAGLALDGLDEGGRLSRLNALGETGSYMGVVRFEPHRMVEAVVLPTDVGYGERPATDRSGRQR